MKKMKRYAGEDGSMVEGDSNEGMKEARDAYDYDRAMKMAEVDAVNDYSPKPEITVFNEKTGSKGGSRPIASKPAPKPAPKATPTGLSKMLRAEDNAPTKANAAKMDEAATEMKRESNRGVGKSTSTAETSSKPTDSYRGFDGKMHKKTESSKPDVGGMIGRGLSSAASSIGSYFKNFETPAERRSRENKESKKMASGGSVSSASKRGDGIAQRGKTRGKMC